MGRGSRRQPRIAFRRCRGDDAQADLPAGLDRKVGRRRADLRDEPVPLRLDREMRLAAEIAEMLDRSGDAGGSVAASPFACPCPCPCLGEAQALRPQRPLHPAI